jgi:hypothetical protein
MKLAAVTIIRDNHMVVELKTTRIDIDFIERAKSLGLGSISIVDGHTCHHHNLLTGQYSKNIMSGNGRWKSVYSC